MIKIPRGFLTIGVFLALGVGVFVTNFKGNSLRAFITGEDLSTQGKDPFLHLEEVEGAKAMEWVLAQNQVTLHEMEADSNYELFFKKALSHLNATDRIAYPGLRGEYVYNFWQDEKNVRGIWRRSPKASYINGAPEWEILLDVDKLADRENENWVYKGNTCLEPEYTYCLLYLSNGGKDAVVIREFDLSKKEFVKNGFFLKEAKSTVQWKDKDTLLIGTDFGEGTLTRAGYPRIVKEWKRGQSLEQAQTIKEIDVEDNGLWLSNLRFPGQPIEQLFVRAINFYENEYWHLQDGQLKKYMVPLHMDIAGRFGDQILVEPKESWVVGDQEFKGGSLLAISIDDITGDIVGKVTEIWSPRPTQSLQRIGITNDAVYTVILDNVRGRALRWTFNQGSWSHQSIELPDNGEVRLVSTDSHSTEVFFSFQGFTTPTSLYVAGPFRPKLVTQLPHKFKSEDIEVLQRQATSRDGTQVPYFVVKPKSTRLTGDNPTLLYGYGGFEIALTPYYSPTTGSLWLEKGGVYVLANIRGGGEFGPSWHRSALKTNRQRAFDDFQAVAEDLIKWGITSSEHLGIQGGSNGGLLVGVSMIQRPDLFKAVLCQVPLLDMLRYHKLLAGYSWTAEYGSPDEEDMRAYLKGYSPYHNVKSEVKYPKAFIMTSTKDDRVHPGHARKMAAKMQTMGHPVYYYENTEGGHAGAANQLQRAKMIALSYVYLWNQLR